MPIKLRSVAAAPLGGSSVVAGALAARGWREALRAHWPEYAMEGALLGGFMIAAGMVGTLLEHPGSAFHASLPVPFLRRVVAGLLMGLTSMALVHTRWGKRSGAHMNPSLTLTFLRLGKVAPWDAAFYVSAQLVGGVAGVLAARIAVGQYVHFSLAHVGMPASVGFWKYSAFVPVSR